MNTPYSGPRRPRDPASPDCGVWCGSAWRRRSANYHRQRDFDCIFLRDATEQVNLLLPFFFSPLSQLWSSDQWKVSWPLLLGSVDPDPGPGLQGGYTKKCMELYSSSYPRSPSFPDQCPGSLLT